MDVFLSHCGAFFSLKNSFFLTFFLGGLTGSLTHCVSMCGPLVACHSMCRAGNCKSVSTFTQFPYHLGRFTTYGALGFLAAFLGRLIAASPYWPAVSATMLALAGAMFLISSLPNCHHFLKPSGSMTYLKGVLLGFMPCGLLYAALMMAATTASPWTGMFGMWMFVLGTLPALILASAGAQMITRKWQGFVPKAGRAVMAFNGIALLVMAERLVR